MENKLRIKEIVKAKGMSVSEFAEKLGIERQNVYNVFTKPSFQRLEQCSEILNMPIQEFFIKDSTEINGYVDYNGAIYHISNLATFFNLVEIVKHSQIE